MTDAAAQPTAPDEHTSREQLAARVGEIVWYHTLELPGGIATSGFVDNRSCARRLPFPALTGLRCLDVGTMNGFWAFELERRGAAEVVTVDVDDIGQIDWPPRTRMVGNMHEFVTPDDRDHTLRGFVLAREALGSNVERRAINVYDLDPEIVGKFDFVFVGSILLHLRDPVLALDRIRSVCAGTAMIFEAIDLAGTLLSPRTPRALLDGQKVWWWTPNLKALERMVESAGFDIEERSGILPMSAGHGFRKVTPRMLLHGGLNMIVGATWGFPHIGLRVHPAG